jgi:hypothetical protein
MGVAELAAHLRKSGQLVANQYHNPQEQTSGGPVRKDVANPKIAEGGPNWPGLPGKTQPGGDRSGGGKKVKVYPQSEGI